jgi:hypothetical protein
MSYHQHQYLNGEITRDSDPLLRYFPPNPLEVQSGWLKNELHLEPPGWVVDPFGTSPFLSLELAQNGFSVLTVSNNPIINFMTRILARAPRELDFKAALSELSKIRRGDEWLDQHLKNLYATQCPQCSQAARALYYIWRKGEPFPDSCAYHCDYCGADGEKQCDPKDFEKLTQLGSDRLHRARALQRVTDLHSNIEEDVNQILDNYLTRPLYFITTLINKIEGSGISQERKELLQALILSICDQGNTLWGYPTVRNRPKQLVTPPSFKEFNLWTALEEAIKLWDDQPVPVELVYYPNRPGSKGGICLYPNRLITIQNFPEAIVPRAALCVFPRPNQAFWTLSALWSGWLWGKEAAVPMISSFERKRYDWNWLDTALSSTLTHLNHLLAPGTPIFSMLSEMDPGFIVACVHAASSSDFHLDAAALNEEDKILQIWWKKANLHPIRDVNISSILQNVIISYLSQAAEPVSYLRLFSNTLLETAEDRILDLYKNKNNQTLLKLFQSDFDKILVTDNRIARYPYDNPNLENTSFGLQKPIESMSMSDQVEMEFVNFMKNNPLQEYETIVNHVFEHFPGLLTPSRDYINACLDSYAEEINALPGFPGKWQLHSRETPQTRKADIQEMISILTHIGTQAGFTIADHNPLIWMNASREKEYIFYIMASTIISRYVYSSGKEARHRIIVLPGSRSRLLSYKLQNDRNLASLVEKGGWRFMKFRHIRALSHKKDLSPEVWLNLINLDPPMWEEAVQLTIFPDESR